MHKNTIKLSWNSIDGIIVEEVKKIAMSRKPDIIVAIKRGGLIPAVMISHAINVREILPIDIRVTVDDSINSDKIEPQIIESQEIFTIKGKNILLVDDIIGSGATYKAAMDYLKKYLPLSIQSFICVVNKNNWRKYNNDLEYMEFGDIGIEVSGWVEFPWEIY